MYTRESHHQSPPPPHTHSHARTRTHAHARTHMHAHTHARTHTRTHSGPVSFRSQEMQRLEKKKKRLVCEVSHSCCHRVLRLLPRFAQFCNANSNSNKCARAQQHSHHLLPTASMAIKAADEVRPPAPQPNLQCYYTCTRRSGVALLSRNLMRLSNSRCINRES